MKKLILFFAFILSITVSAQTSLKFKTNSISDVRQLADSIALNAKRIYTFDKDGVSKDDANYYIVRYKNTSDDEDKLTVLFRIEQIGENDALEIKGTPEYHFYGAAGKFLDLFPFWHKFINPKSIAETVANDKSDNIMLNDIRFSIRDYNGYWKIDARYKQ